MRAITILMERKTSFYRMFREISMNHGHLWHHHTASLDSKHDLVAAVKARVASISKRNFGILIRDSISFVIFFETQANTGFQFGILMGSHSFAAPIDQCIIIVGWRLAHYARWRIDHRHNNNTTTTATSVCVQLHSWPLPRARGSCTQRGVRRHRYRSRCILLHRSTATDPVGGVRCR